MAFERMNDDLNIIAKLGDIPGNDGVTPQELKALFDKASLLLQSFINNKLIPEIEKQNVGLPIGGGTMEGAINMNGQPIRGLNAPTEGSQAANKEYVDNNKVDKSKVINNFNTMEAGFVADARALKVLNDTKTSMKLLWRNGSPTSGFGEGTIDLIENSAKWFIGRFRSFDSYRVSEAIFKPGETVVLTSANCMGPMFASNLMTLMREIKTIKQTTITFSRGYYNDASGTASAWNEMANILVPVEIYGIEEISE